MDFPLPVKALNILVSSGKPTKDLISLKLGQQIEAKVLQVSLESNIIKLQLGKTTVEVQPLPPLFSNQDSSDDQTSFTLGQTLKLQVAKLIPTPELTIEKTVALTKQTNHNEVVSAKNQQAELANKVETKPIILKLLTNQNVPTKAIANTPSKLPILKVGQQILAKVIASNNKQIQLKLLPEPKTSNTSQQRAFKSAPIISIDLQKDVQLKPSLGKVIVPTPQIMTGQTVNLEVTKVGVEPQFKIPEKLLSTAPPEKLISETVKQMLPIQQTPEAFVNRLILNLPTLSKNTNLPETLHRLAQQILQNLPSKSHLSQPQRIKQSINNSGVFLESKLAQSETPKLQTQADFKANILKFLQELKQLPPPTPQSESNAQEREINILKQLQNSGESSVAKLVLDQLNSLPKEDSPKQIWHLEIPYVDQKDAQALSLQIEKDKENDVEDGKGNWSVNITLTPPNLGKLHCKISCYDQIVNTHFWSDLQKTTNLIDRNLDYLKSQLEASGLKTGQMESYQDTPTLNPTINLSNSNLIDEQI